MRATWAASVMAVTLFVLPICTLSRAQADAVRDIPPSPFYKNPAPSFYPGFPDCIPAAELVGFDLLINGAGARDAIPEITVGTPVDFVLHLVPRVADCERVRLRVGIEAGENRVDFVLPIHSADWQVGKPYAQHCPLRVPPFSAIGRGILTVAMLEETPSLLRVAQTNVSDTWVPESVVFIGEINILPSVTDATVSPALLDAALGANTTPLRRAFRIGPGQRVVVPTSSVQAISGIAVASALRGVGAIRQSDDVLKIAALNSDQPVATGIIRAGEGTGIAEQDAYRPGVITIKMSEILERTPYPWRTWKNGGLQACTYLARIPMRADHISSLVFENVSGLCLDVYDVALLHDPASLLPASRK